MKKKSLIWGLLSFCSTAIMALPQEGFLRYPSLSSKEIFFCSGGNVWKAPLEGGNGTCLTQSRDGYYSHPKVSPDGGAILVKLSEGIGKERGDLYVISSLNGNLEQVTYGQLGVYPIGWKSESEIIYGTYSGALRNSWVPSLKILNLVTKEHTSIELLGASDLSYVQEENCIFFTYRPFQGSFTRQYRGGCLRQIWKYTFSEEEAVNLSSLEDGNCFYPVYSKGRIYFLSDKTGCVNVWSMNLQGQDRQQHTQRTDFDVDALSVYGDHICYQIGPDFYLYDRKTQKDQKVSIECPSDYSHLQKKKLTFPDILKTVSSLNISPEGDKVVLGSRGHLFTLPVKEGRKVSLHADLEGRFRFPSYIKDNQLLVVSDVEGDCGLYTMDDRGRGDLCRRLPPQKGFKHPPLSCPDGSKIAYCDSQGNFWICCLNEKEGVEKIDQDPFISENPNLRTPLERIDYIPIMDWSPDGNWLAYEKGSSSGYSQIYLYDTQTKKSYCVTSKKYHSYCPRWSYDGRWLCFFSEDVLKSFPESLRYQETPFLKTLAHVCCLGMCKDSEWPFLEATELDVEKEKHKNEQLPGIIEVGDLQKHFYRLPIDPHAYKNLLFMNNYLYLMAQEEGGPPQVMAVDLNQKDLPVRLISRDKALIAGSRNQSKLLMCSKDIYVIDANGMPPQNWDETALNLKHLTLEIDPKKEFHQIYEEAWRYERDFFYDPSMKQKDWDSVYKKYYNWVDRCASRQDLDVVLAHMISELESLHSFVIPSPLYDKEKKHNLYACLGGDLVKSSDGRGFVIQQLSSYIDEQKMKSPLDLARPPVSEGDLITHVNHKSLSECVFIEEYLWGQKNQQVLLTLERKSTGERYESIVKPTSLIKDLERKFSLWKWHNQQKVEQDSQAEVGYIPLSGLMYQDYSEWVKYYFPQMNKKGLILDLRYNTGGNIHSVMVQRLLQKNWSWGWNRNMATGPLLKEMIYATDAHCVVLCNEYSCSDAEFFCEAFRKLGLGVIIGSRTWGGGAGIYADHAFVDGGGITISEVVFADTEGRFLLEGTGVQPDIEIKNYPREEFLGKDRQLEYALQYLQEKIKTEPLREPSLPRLQN